MRNAANSALGQSSITCSLSYTQCQLHLVHISMSDFQQSLHEQTVQEWGELNQIHPHAHISSMS